MKRWMPRLLPLLAAATLGACANDLPTSVEEGLLPVTPVSVEVRLPWSQFASGLRVLGGYGRANELRRGYLAHEFAGELDARTLMHLAPFPRSAQVQDADGTTRTDSAFTYVGGILVVRFDTLSSTTRDPLSFNLDRTTVPWDFRTASWDLAVDSVGGQLPWPVEGGGPVERLGSSLWFPATGDSALVYLDSAAVAALADTTTDHGFRLSTDTPGERVEVTFAQLQLDIRPSLHPDTVVSLPVDVRDLTFIYTPSASAPDGEFRVGGVPAWRTVFTLNLPATVPGSAAACALVGCPLTLTAERVNHAGLLLTSRPPPDPGFRPVDSLRVDIRGVLAPEALPKSPLTGPLFTSAFGEPLGTAVPAAAFFQGGQRSVEVPLTPVVQDLLRGETLGGEAPSATVALLSMFEPLALAYGSFSGPGGEGEPVLRLVLTVSGGAELP